MIDKLIYTDIDGHKGCFGLSKDKLYKAYFLTENKSQVGNIYIGRVANILPNLNAAFVEYQKGVQGFLPLSKDELSKLKCESRILVQIKKAKVKTKEAVLTTEISIPGLYCVGFLDENSLLSFSKKISNEKNKAIRAYLESEALNQASTSLSTSSIGFVIRSNMISIDESDFILLKNEMDEMSGILSHIKEAFQTRNFYTDLSPAKDFIKDSINELSFMEFPDITADKKEDYERLQSILPTALQEKIHLYEDEKYPLSALHGLRAKLSEAVSKTVWLKSGGYLVIEPTEAMVVVDVNTGKNLKKLSKNELINITNKEACDTLAHILPAANYSGIIVVDFINYMDKEAENKLLPYLKNLFKEDPVKTEVIDITSLGLVEITRRKNDVLLITQMKELGIEL